MEEISARFEVIRLAFKMADYDVIEIQAKRLKEISYDQEINSISELLLSKNYRQALFMMKQFMENIVTNQKNKKHSDSSAEKSDTEAISENINSSADSQLDKQHEPTLSTDNDSDTDVPRKNEDVQHEELVNTCDNVVDMDVEEPKEVTDAPIEIKTIEIELGQNIGPLADAIIKNQAAEVSLAKTKKTVKKQTKINETQEYPSDSLFGDLQYYEEEMVETNLLLDEELENEISTLQDVPKQGITREDETDMQNQFPSEKEKQESQFKESQKETIMAKEAIEETSAKQSPYVETMPDIGDSESLKMEIETDLRIEEDVSLVKESFDIQENDSFDNKRVDFQKRQSQGSQIEETNKEAVAQNQSSSRINLDDMLMLAKKNSNPRSGTMDERKKIDHSVLESPESIDTTQSIKDEVVQKAEVFTPIKENALKDIALDESTLSHANLDISKKKEKNKIKYTRDPADISLKSASEPMPNTSNTESSKRKEEKFNTAEEEIVYYKAIPHIGQKYRNMMHQFPQLEVSDIGISEHVTTLSNKISSHGYSDDDIYEGITFYEQSKDVGNKAEAAQMLLLLGTTESKFAQLLLARELFKGEILEANFAESFTHINRLAEQDYPEAICDLAQLYEFGYGIKKDKKIAKILYEEASSMGVNRASRHLARLTKKKGILSSFLNR